MKHYTVNTSADNVMLIVLLIEGVLQYCLGAVSKKKQLMEFSIKLAGWVLDARFSIKKKKLTWS